jgi:hypothetical protein
MFDPEIEALLSGYSAGTLTAEEQSRLYERALTDQALFDALTEAETMRAALASPATKERLLSKLESPQPPSRRAFRWLGLVAALIIIPTAILYRPDEITQLPTPPPSAPAPQQAKVAEPPPPAAPTQTAPQPKAIARRSAAPVTTAEPLAPAAAPAAIAESREEPKGEAAPAAKSVADSAMLNSFRASAPAPTRHSFTFPAPRYVYIYLVEGTKLTALPVANPAQSGAVAIPAHAPGAQIWTLGLSAPDPALENLTTGPLPDRQWAKRTLD